MYTLRAKYSRGILNNIKKLAIHEGFKLDELSLKKEENFALLNLSFQATEEKEQKFNESLLNLADVLEMKIE
jgi:putative Mg2+ transporter-C (MgtC) family protein